MRTLLSNWRRRLSLRTRVLTMALVPSVALLLGGVILASFLIVGAVHSRSMSTAVEEATPEGQAFFRAVRHERSVTLRTLSDQPVDKAELQKARKNLSNTTDELFTKLREHLSPVAPESVQRSIKRDEANLANLDDIRSRVDTDDIDLTEAYSYYNKLMDEFAFGLTALAKDFGDAEIAYLRLKAMPLFLAADELSRAHAYAAAALSSGSMSAEQFRVFSDEIGAYRENLSATEPSMLSDVHAGYEELRDSDSWSDVTEVENAILSGDTDLPMSPDEWQDAVSDVGKNIGALYFEQSGYATDLSLQRTKDTLIWSIVGGAAAVLFGVAVFVVALRSANRLVARLTRLRGETLDMAEHQLPDLVSAVREGQHDENDIDDMRVDAGTDEIGQVADAFNKAQQTAIAAAVEEARIREGTRTVFLNIAHRSQVIVHRQLKALDEAERTQEDPDQLDLLFQLDHLSTRARRNAENLIILGGKQPGRQWRNPVAIDDVVRGAVAETEDYARVSVGQLPETAVQGAAVGDVVHLLAELVDNATAYSPPQSRVELRGNAVGRGVVLEVEDQGLGIEQERRAELNRMLANPPEFSVMTLSAEPRLGLFVVARLAGRHGINVTLRESAYGGTRAIVLLRTDLIQSEPEKEPVDEIPQQQQPPWSPLQRQANSGPQMTTGTTGQLNGQLDEFQTGWPDGSSADPKPSLPGRHNTGHAVNGSHPPRASDATSNGRHQASGPGPQPPAPQQSAPQQPAPQQPPQQTQQPPRRDPETAERQHEPSMFRDSRADDAEAQQGLSPDRPPLPQRRRQEHIAPQLRAEGAADDAGQAHPTVEETSPETSRNRLTAFQQGTRQAREQEDTSREQ